MMRLPSFSFIDATSVDEATRALADDPQNTRLVAGGTDLWPNMKRRHQAADTVVSLRRVEGLEGIGGDPSDEVRIGAMTSLTEVCTHPMIVSSYPGLARAVASISTPVLRNMGTLGGNLALDTRCTYYNQNEEWRSSIGFCKKEAGETCWVAPKSPRCWAISASDSAPLLCAIDAKVKAVSKDGDRVLPVEALYREDGIDYLSLRRDEILTDVFLPNMQGGRATYWKLRRRGSIDFPVLGVGAALRLDGDDVVTRARIFVGAVVSAPTEAKAAGEFLQGKRLDEDIVAEAARLARKVATPLDNTDYQIPWRSRMVEVYTEGALRELSGLPSKTRTPTHGGWALGA